MSEKIVQLNEEVIKGQIKELVRGSVEETLNELLEKEAESLTQAARYERSEARQGYRSGHYDRNLTTTSGDVTLHMPRLKGVSFETAIIERYRRRESSVEEALIEMYLAGVSVRRVEDITEVSSGLRQCELITLSWADFYVRYRYILKGQRLLTLNAKAERLLKQIPETDSPYVFRNPKTGAPYKLYEFYYLHKKILRRARLPWVAFRDLQRQFMEVGI